MNRIVKYRLQKTTFSIWWLVPVEALVSIRLIRR